MMHRIFGVTAALLVGGTATLAALHSTSSAEAQNLGTAASETPTEFTIDPVHSSIVFQIKHLDTTYVYGRFNEMEGTFTLDPDNAAQSRIEIEVPAASIDTNNEQRDNHLRSPDFFNAREHSTLRFESTAIERAGSDAFRATGDLTIHGRTHEITVDIEKTGESDTQQFGKRKGWKTTFTVDRMDYGVDYMPDGLGHDVEVTVSIQGVVE